jgi:hypothetical protein
MGTWDTSIESNDTYLEVYSAFMERYNLVTNQDKLFRTFFQSTVTISMTRTTKTMRSSD